SMGSDEIDYIEYVLEDRLFGDLPFSRVLAVYLNDGSNSCMSQQPNRFRYTIPLLQPKRTPPMPSNENIPGNIPDFRQVYYWQLHDVSDASEIEFRLSDLKGRVKISVEGVSPQGITYHSSEIIEVK